MDSIPLILSGLAVALTAVLKYAIDRRDREIDEKLKDAKAADDKQKTADDEQKTKLTDEIKSLTKRNHEIELNHAKLEGEVKVLSKTTTTIETDLKDIKDEMVPRQEWREAQQRVETAQERIEHKFDNIMRTLPWRSSSSSSMQAQRSIPREEVEIDDFKIRPKDKQNR